MVETSGPVRLGCSAEGMEFLLSYIEAGTEYIRHKAAHRLHHWDKVACCENCSVSRSGCSYCSVDVSEVCLPTRARSIDGLLSQIKL